MVHHPIDASVKTVFRFAVGWKPVDTSLGRSLLRNGTKVGKDANNQMNQSELETKYITVTMRTKTCVCVSLYLSVFVSPVSPLSNTYNKRIFHFQS